MEIRVLFPREILSSNPFYPLNPCSKNNFWIINGNSCSFSLRDLIELFESFE